MCAAQFWMDRMGKGCKNCAIMRLLSSLASSFDSSPDVHAPGLYFFCARTKSAPKAEKFKRIQWHLVPRRGHLEGSYFNGLLKSFDFS